MAQANDSAGAGFRFLEFWRLLGGLRQQAVLERDDKKSARVTLQAAACTQNTGNVVQGVSSTCMDVPQPYTRLPVFRLQAATCAWGVAPKP